MDFSAARKIMVDSQVRVNDVTDRALQAAMLAVPRERFVPSDRAFSAYAEVEVMGSGTANGNFTMIRDDTISPGKSTPSQQEPAAKRTAFSIFLNRAISSCEFLHTCTIGNGI